MSAGIHAYNTGDAGLIPRRAAFRRTRFSGIPARPDRNAPGRPERHNRKAGPRADRPG
jgi:hypothetical protein